MSKKPPREPNEAPPSAAAPTETASLGGGPPARDQQDGGGSKKSRKNSVGAKKGKRSGKAGDRINVKGRDHVVTITKGRGNKARGLATRIRVTRKWVTVGTTALVVAVGGGVYVVTGNDGDPSGRSGSGDAHSTPSSSASTTGGPDETASASTSAKSPRPSADPTGTVGGDIDSQTGGGSDGGTGTGTAGGNDSGTGTGAGGDDGAGTGTSTGTGGSGSTTSVGKEPKTTQTRSGTTPETTAPPAFRVTGGSCDVSDAATAQKTLGNQSSGFTRGGTTYDEIVEASDGTTPIATSYDHNGEVSAQSSQWSWLCEAGDPPGTYKVRVQDVASGRWSNWSSMVINP